MAADHAGAVRGSPRDIWRPVRYIALVTYLFTTVLDGRNVHVTDGMYRALGRKPRDFSQYVRDTATAGVWRHRPTSASARQGLSLAE